MQHETLFQEFLNLRESSGRKNDAKTIHHWRSFLKPYSKKQRELILTRSITNGWYCLYPVRVNLCDPLRQPSAT